jgi:hypothetical protein
MYAGRDQQQWSMPHEDFLYQRSHVFVSAIQQQLRHIYTASLIASLTGVHCGVHACHARPSIHQRKMSVLGLSSDRRVLVRVYKYMNYINWLARDEGALLVAAILFRDEVLWLVVCRRGNLSCFL